MSSGNDRASQLSEKHYNEHTEQIHPVSGAHHDVVEDENTFEVEEEQLPKGYFTSPFFIGTMTGICLGLVAGVAGFGFIAPILGVINADIGPVSSTSRRSPQSTNANTLLSGRQYRLGRPDLHSHLRSLPHHHRSCNRHLRPSLDLRRWCLLRYHRFHHMRRLHKRQYAHRRHDRRRYRCLNPTLLLLCHG